MAAASFCLFSQSCISFLVSAQPPLPLQAFLNLQELSSVLHPPKALQSLSPAQSWTFGNFFAGAALPGAALVLALAVTFVPSAKACRTPAPLSRPAMAATRTFRDTFFIKLAISNQFHCGTTPLRAQAEMPGKRAISILSWTLASRDGNRAIVQSRCAWRRWLTGSRRLGSPKSMNFIG